MPPLLVHDPLDAAQRAPHPGWWIAPATAMSVACEPWVLTLIALAVFAWRERDVPSALKAFAPIPVALGVGAGLVLGGARAGAWAGWGVRAIPSGHALWGAVFAAYLLRLYGLRSGLLASLLPLAGGLARIYLGSNGLPSVAAGWALGAALGLAAFAVAGKVAPTSPAGLRRGGRRGGAAGGTGERDVTP
jgi:membrane-associated phospholipid phosphatase